MKKASGISREFLRSVESFFSNSCWHNENRRTILNLSFFCRNSIFEKYCSSSIPFCSNVLAFLSVNFTDDQYLSKVFSFALESRTVLRTTIHAKNGTFLSFLPHMLFFFFSKKFFLSIFFYTNCKDEWVFFELVNRVSSFLSPPRVPPHFFKKRSRFSFFLLLHLLPRSECVWNCQLNRKKWIFHSLQFMIKIDIKRYWI